MKTKCLNGILTVGLWMDYSLVGSVMLVTGDAGHW